MSFVSLKSPTTANIPQQHSRLPSTHSNKTCIKQVTVSQCCKQHQIVNRYLSIIVDVRCPGHFMRIPRSSCKLKTDRRTRFRRDGCQAGLSPEPSPVQLGSGGSPPWDRVGLCKGVLFLRDQVLGLRQQSVHCLFLGGGHQKDVGTDRRVHQLGPPTVQRGQVSITFHVVPRWEESGPPEGVQTW